MRATWGPWIELPEGHGMSYDQFDELVMRPGNLIRVGLRAGGVEEKLVGDINDHRGECDHCFVPQDAIVAYRVATIEEDA